MCDTCGAVRLLAMARAQQGKQGQDNNKPKRAGGWGRYSSRLRGLQGAATV